MNAPFRGTNGELNLLELLQLSQVGLGHLAMVAKLVPRGRAVGLDLWRSEDQSGNKPQATWRNLDIEGVRDR